MQIIALKIYIVPTCYLSINVFIVAIRRLRQQQQRDVEFVKNNSQEPGCEPRVIYCCENTGKNNIIYRGH